MAKTLELNSWTRVELRQAALAAGGGHLFVDEARWWEKRREASLKRSRKDHQKLYSKCQIEHRLAL